MESGFVHVASGDRVFTVSPELLWGIKVKRDMEVIRTILRAIQEKSDLRYVEMTFDGVDDLTAGRHVEMLLQGGYIDALDSKIIGSRFPRIQVRDLTWQGHELAGALLADEPTWQKVKSAVGADGLSKLPLKVIQEIATKALSAWAMHKLGPLGL